MKKNVENTASEHISATPDQIAEYKRLKARNEWIKMNEKRLDEIEANKLRHEKTVLVLVIINIVLTVLNHVL